MGKLSRRKLTKATLVYKILNDHSSPNLKAFLIKRNISQTTYDLRNAQNHLAVPKARRYFQKRVLDIVVLNYGMIFLVKLRKPYQYALLQKYCKAN